VHLLSRAYRGGKRVRGRNGSEPETLGAIVNASQDGSEEVFTTGKIIALDLKKVY
jgi:hypothetical protein